MSPTKPPDSAIKPIQTMPPGAGTLLAGTLLCLMLAPHPARAFAWSESGDAGELPSTSQGVFGLGNLSTISGTLISLGTRKDDIDLYRFIINRPKSFSVSTSANLTGDNDASLFLFDEAGNLALYNDDGGPGLLPQFNPGDLTGSAGVYILGISLYATQPQLTPTLTGWNRFPFPFQTGTYTLSITGAVGVPGPLPILGLGAAFGYSRKLRKRIKAPLA
jgi:hypothetical protein